MPQNNGPPLTLQIAGQLHQEFERATQMAMLHVGQETGAGPQETSYIGVMAALAPIMLTAGVFSKKPEWAKAKAKNDNSGDDFTLDDIRKVASEVMTPETVMFAALAAAYTMKSFDHTGNLEAGYGPPTLWQALEAWTKIFPGLKADNYFDANMLKAARIAGAEVEKPFDEFLQGRITHRNSPDSLN